MSEPNIQIREVVDCMPALEKELREMGIQNMGACIGVPEVEDEYLTCDSVHFHEHLGFRMVGEFYKCGFKFGRFSRLFGHGQKKVPSESCRNPNFQKLFITP